MVWITITKRFWRSCVSSVGRSKHHLTAWSLGESSSSGSVFLSVDERELQLQAWKTPVLFEIKKTKTKEAQPLLFCGIGRRQSVNNFNRERRPTSAGSPSVSSQWRAESRILAEHSKSLRGKLRFIFKPLEFPFPFDCSLKLLWISLARRADIQRCKIVLRTIFVSVRLDSAASGNRWEKE